MRRTDGTQVSGKSVATVSRVYRLRHPHKTGRYSTLTPERHTVRKGYVQYSTVNWKWASLFLVWNFSVIAVVQYSKLN